MVKKSVIFDEIEFYLTFSKDGYLEKIEINTKDKEVFPSMALDKESLIMVTDTLANNIKHVLRNVKPAVVPLPNKIDKDYLKKVEASFRCPKHGSTMHLETGCCGRPHKMRCEVCGYVIQLPVNFIEKLKNKQIEIS